MNFSDEEFFNSVKKIDVLADELETEITASMQTCLIRFGEIVQIQNAMIQKMHALSDEIFHAYRRLRNMYSQTRESSG